MKKLIIVMVGLALLFSGAVYAQDTGYNIDFESKVDDLWIRAVINTEEAGSIEAVWRQGGQAVTERGDEVIWGHFYASSEDVTWGSMDNPDLYVKIWFDQGGRLDVNFFHVSVPDIQVESAYPADGSVDEQGTTTLVTRYIRQYYENGLSNSESQDEDGNPAPGYSENNTPLAYNTINDLEIGSSIITEEIGAADALWFEGGRDATERGDEVVWGFFYANPQDVSWGSAQNPDLFVKIWFDASGRIDVNFFHVSVPDIEVYSDYPVDGTYDQSGTTIMADRYIRQEYTRQTEPTCDPVATDWAPRGESEIARPNIWTAISSPCGVAIDQSSIVMEVDRVVVEHAVSGSGSEVTASYTPTEILQENANHEVEVRASDVEGGSVVHTWIFYVPFVY